ncbi:MAG: histidine kinase [Mycobacteriales bacterium]|nr:histidine kinase [Mycobacteriales bacterium]
MGPLLRRRGRPVFVSPAEQATHDALHEASLLARPLREGLTVDAAARSAPHLHRLLGGAAVALHDLESLLVWEGSGDHHVPTSTADEAMADGRTTISRDLACTVPDCPVRTAVVTPLVVDDRVVGALGSYSSSVSPGRVRTVEEVARWVSGQLELAELDDSRRRLGEAQMSALRAQISPHFVYNALTAIASFVRTDPERARALLLDFADFTRYSSRTHGDYTTLAEELRSIDRYLRLERARFGDRLDVVLRVAPEVLPVAVPYLCLQPLVENAVKHGMEAGTGRVTIAILAEDAGADCTISVEDDGAGSDPDRIRAALAGTAGRSQGLSNVDARLRAVFGDDHGLVVETAPGAGTKVSLRVPKFVAGVRAS